MQPQSEGGLTSPVQRLYGCLIRRVGFPDRAFFQPLLVGIGDQGAEVPSETPTNLGISTGMKGSLHRGVSDQPDSPLSQRGGHFRSAKCLAFDIALLAIAAVGDGVIEITGMAHQLSDAHWQRLDGG
jgi:hypothetical protein